MHEEDLFNWVGGVAVLGLFAFSIANTHINETHEFITLTRDAEAVGFIGNKYRVYSDQGIFVNQDELWRWRWSASELNADMLAGNSCVVTAVGYEVPIIAPRRKIIDGACGSEARRVG